jgi:hypothetical protein
MGKTEAVKGLEELGDGVVAAYLTEGLELATKETAAYVRVIYPDGRSVLGKIEKPRLPKVSLQ